VNAEAPGPLALEAQLRVLALLPTARDAQLTAELLHRDGIAVEACGTDAELARQLARGAGAVLIAEELLGPDGAHGALLEHIDAQPRWSDLPVLLLTGSGADSPTVKGALGLLGNVTLLERPMRVSALVSTVRAALRARSRQYQLAQHLRELEEARTAVALEARRKDEFLAMLAHELRNPLAPVRNALHVLELDDADPDRRKALRGVMLRQVDHMVRLVSDLVEASRLSQGKITLQRQPIDLREALRDALDVGRAQAMVRHQSLTLSLPEEPLHMLADPVRMAQVFGNLVHNAAKYGRADGRIDVSARREGEWAMVAVEDDGIGIAPALLPRVFDLFTQGQRDGQRMPEGLGIGLALVRSLVEMHGGHVTARSEGRDRGARFEVRLPLHAAALQPAPRPAAAPDACPPGAPLRVLVVDDNVDAAESLGLVLDALGMERRVAHGGWEGLALAQAFRPDVALLDLGMPGLDGYGLARRLRADPRHAGLVLAALTGWSGPEDRRAGLEAGFDHHITKPADVQALTALLLAERDRRAATLAEAG
jgi:signal transduction histidine kinase/ActR/RegA family two-component response regulator